MEAVFPFISKKAVQICAVVCSGFKRKHLIITICCDKHCTEPLNFSTSYCCFLIYLFICVVLVLQQYSCVNTFCNRIRRNDIFYNCAKEFTFSYNWKLRRRIRWEPGRGIGYRSCVWSNSAWSRVSLV